VPSDEIFCTSLPGHNVPAGEDFIRFIRANIKETSRVVLVLSKNYYDSVFCVGELGAAWALEVPTFPLIVPPLRISEVSRNFLSTTQMGEITSDAYLASLRDVLIEQHGIKGGRTDNWQVRSRIFLNKIVDIVNKLPQPDKVDRAEFDQLQKQFDRTLELLSESEEKIKVKDEIIEKLKQLKDSEQVNAVLTTYSSVWEQFEAILAEVGNQLYRLPPVVRQAFFYSQKGQEMVIPMYDAREDSVQDAFDKGYLKLGEHGYLVKFDSQEVLDASEALTHLSQFLHEASAEFIEEYRRKHKYDPSLSNKRFWTDNELF
jgi:uncharacterized protein YutD